MADFFKGLAGGFSTGLQFGQAMRQRRMEDDLAQAYAKPEEFTDYTPEQQRQIRDLQASGAYDVSAVPGAEGAAPTLRYAPRRGLNLQGDVPAEGAYIDVAPQQVQRYGGQTMAGRFDPTQLRGLQMQEAARVLGSYGDVRGAAALQAQAAEQEFQAKYRPLLLQSTEGQIAGQGLTQEAQRLTITEAQKKVKQDESNRLAGTRLAELAAAGTPIDTATANRIAKETGADMTFVTDAVLKQYSLTKASANDLIERQLAEFDKAAKGGLPTLNKYIAERLDPDKTDNIVPTVVQGPDGKLRVMYGDKPLPGYQAYGGIDQLSAAFQGNIKRDPLGAAIQISTLDTQAQARLASQSTIRSSDSAIALRNEQLQMLKKQAAGNAEAQKIRTDYEALTPEEQVGAKGQGLIRQFNMANIKAGTPIPLGAAPRAEGPVRMDDVDRENLRYYRDWLKNPKNEKLPQGQKDKFAEELGVSQFIKRAAGGPATGLGSNPFPAGAPTATPAAAPAAPAAPAAAPAAPALSMENTKILSAAGKGSWNVQLPDGTTRIMSEAELNRLGYQFLRR